MLAQIFCGSDQDEDFADFSLYYPSDECHIHNSSVHLFLCPPDHF